MGIYLLPNPEDKAMQVMLGCYFVKQGIYTDAVIKFKVVFPDNYPKAMPKVYFSSEVFHPLVHPETRELRL